LKAKIYLYIFLLQVNLNQKCKGKVVKVLMGGHWWQRLQKAKDKYLKLVKALNIFYPCPFALNTEG
jgi:hypothetical protein